jgi:uncharacterized protein YbdZ (MbtH family)
MTTTHPVVVLLDEYRRALDYTEALWADLPAHEIAWRRADEFSPVVNHEYQHSQWISEVRHCHLGHALASRPTSPRLVELDGYVVLNVST